MLYLWENKICKSNHPVESGARNQLILEVCEYRQFKTDVNNGRSNNGYDHNCIGENIPSG